MLNIAICDDNVMDIRMIKTNVIKVLSKMNLEFRIENFTNAFTMLEKDSNNLYDLIFLDIDMPKINGMDVAARLNCQTRIAEIIFVTNHDELVYRAYRFKALGFIRKKYLEAEIGEIIELFIEQTNQRRNYLFIHDAGSEKKITIEEIIYMQSDDHYVEIFKTNGKELIRKSLNDMEKEYMIYGFIRIHARYLVNYRYIYSIERCTVILTDNKQLPLSRSRVNSVKDSFQMFSRSI